MGKNTSNKPAANDAKNKKETGVVPLKLPKKPASAPLQHVSLTRCVSRLKKELNSVKDTELSDFKKGNDRYFNNLGELIKSKQKKTKEEKDAINEKIRELKKGNKISEEYYSIKKNLYRVTNSATAYTATVLEYVVTELLTYGIQATLRDTKNQKSPKLTLPRFISDENRPEVLKLSSVPLINSLSSFKNIDKIGIDKEDIGTENNEGKKTDGKKGTAGDGKKPSPPYDTIITRRFKSLCHEHAGAQKVCCSALVKVLISNIIIELINHFTKELRIVVGKLSKTKTITDIHIKGSIEMSFLFNETDDTNNYDSFITKVDELHKKSQDLKQSAKSSSTK